MSDNLEEAAYYIRFIRMYIDVATDAVLKVFFHVTPSQSVDTLFASDDVKKKLESMRKNNILSRREYELVSRAHIRPASFDLSLLITLLTNLFSGKLPAPKNGWKLPVDDTDFTIAADLLRLREIRNKILAHQPSAKLIKSKFERLWDDVKNILVRLIQQVDSNYVTTLEEKITEYENTTLDPHDSFGTYLDTFQEWFDEVLNLQSEVEELSSKLKELQLYFKTKPARYSRYIRLLLEGGKLVLCGLLKSLLPERGPTLNVSLQGKCAKLREQIGDEELLKQLFPNASDMAETNLDIDKWDIAVLACVVICILNDDENSEDVINGVASILKARKSYADSALVALDNERFSTVSEDLLMNLSMLSTRLDVQDRKRFKEIIATNKNENFEKYFEELKSHGHGIKSIVDTYNETLCQLKGYLKTMADTGVSFLEKHILDLKIVTLGNDEEKRKMVEDSVATVWQAALERSGNPSDFTTVRESLDIILDDIRRIPDVEVDNVKRGCILFSLKCKSWRAIFQLVEYLESATFKKQLRTISIEVSLLQDDVISLQGHLTLESVLDILNRTQTDDETAHTLCVPIKCSSVRGMKEVLKVLSNEETTNRFLEIAGTLSQTGHEISLNVYPEVYGFKEVFSETGFPNVTGVIDCTHVRIQAPSLNEPDYVNRKGFHSINVQAVCDAQFRIINLVAKWPGSVHDSRVFRESQLCRQLETGHVNGILLGDSGYACRPYLMTPYLNPQTATQERFNEALVKTRVLIEQTFGVMKRRFPCLSYGLRCNPLRACETTAACAVLHNFGLMRGDMFCRNTDVALDPPDNRVDGAAQLGQGARCRDVMANAYF